MPFLVEDGTGVDGANSYCSVADADDYHTLRGNTAWTGVQSVKEAALVKATDYIEQEYRDAWQGTRVTITQDLEWPRYDMPSGVDGYYRNADDIPQELKDATALLAIEYITSGELNPNLDRGGMVSREKTDVIETEYFQGASPKTVRPAIDGLLRRYLNGSGGVNRPVVRR